MMLAGRRTTRLSSTWNHRTFRFLLIVLLSIHITGALQAADLPKWIGAVDVAPPNDLRVGAITLSGEWLDTCTPNMITHRVTDATIDLIVEHDGINVGCGDAITPWSLTETCQRV